MPSTKAQVSASGFEKATVDELTRWAEAKGWERTDPSGYEFHRDLPADLVLRRGDQILRMDVKYSPRWREGMVRIQAVPTFREAILVYRGEWTLELGGVPLDRPWDSETFAWLLERLFAA